jgi:dienelactone hydrolase
VAGYLLLSPASAAFAQDTAAGARAMTVDDFALWRSVGQTGLSPDGRWVAYAYSRREVDDSLFIRRLDGGEPHVVVRGGTPTFSADSRWVAYYINPEEDSGGRGSAAGGAGGGRGRGGGGGQDPRAVELRDLRDGDTRRWENVRAFAFADEGRALVLEKRAPDPDAEYEGTDLLVRYLDVGEEELLSYVNEWALDEAGARLAYTIDSPDGEANGVSLLDLSTRVRRALDAEREVEYTRLTWGGDEDEAAADALAVLKGADDDDLVERVNALLAWPAVSTSTTPVVLDPRPEKAEGEEAEGNGAAGVPVNGLPADWVLSEKGALTWAPDASRLFVATRYQQAAPSTLCEPPKDEAGRDGRGARASATDSAKAGEGDTAAVAPKIFRMASRVGPDGRPLGPEEILDGECPEFVADVDIWHGDDARLQSVQIVRATRDRNQTYQSVVHLDASGPRFVQLSDTTLATLQVSDRGNAAMGSDGRAHESDWLPSYADWYMVDLDTGERTLVLDKHLRTLGFSPDGDHFLYWKDAAVWSYALRTGEHADLTSAVPVTFENEEYDRLGEKPPYGIAGWTADSAAVILEHRYDLWRVPLDGGTPTDLTGGAGVRGEVRFRILDLDPDEDLVDLSEPLVLTAYGQWTKKAGFYRLAGGDLEELVFDDASFGPVEKADSADVLLYTREDFRTFPDYLVSGLDFSEPDRITDANPQQAEFAWGRSILIDYETHDGVRLQGVLAIPDGWEPGQRLPMIVDFYEKMSQRLHSYPRPIFRDTPMVAHYVSAGYLVLLPDVHYRLGATHAQMLESIELALDEVEEMGYVDPERLGLHGHSFSGQGSDYIATHSDRFAAIVAGAAASNLVSDFNQLWKSSGTNQHGYDTYGQGRFGTNPYDDLELFMDQSGTFNAANMNTPLLLLHGTADGSVEWLQAVEFYNALRWFGKNVILASYPDEPHHLARYENQKDFQIRMRQFYDHYLMDVPAPRWMTDGRTFIQKERDRGMLEKAGNGGGGGGGGGGGS